MTANSTTTRELDINKIVLRAYQQAGLADAQQPMVGADWDAKAAMARDFLETMLDSLHAEGVFARSVDFYDVTVTAGTATYSLPSSTLDVVGDATFVETGGSTELVVRPASREEYHTLSRKDAQGTPHMYYLHRMATLQIYLYLTPNKAGTLKLQRHRLLGDADDGSATLDLQRYWTEWAIWSLAHKLSAAAKHSVQRLAYLDAQAKYYLRKAKGYAHQHVPNIATVRHSTQWSR